jgi:hypothetical protein
MEHNVRDEGVAGSNPATPTNTYIICSGLLRQIPRQNKIGLGALWNAAAARLHAGNVIKSPRSPCELVDAPSRVIPLGSA